MNLGSALVSVGRGTEAVGILRAGASLDGSGLKDRRAHEAARVQALLQLGGLYADQGKLQGALSAYKEALHVLPEHYPPQVSPHRRFLLRTINLIPASHASISAAISCFLKIILSEFLILSSMTFFSVTLSKKVKKLDIPSHQ